MVFLETLGYLDGGIWHRADFSNIFGENMAALMIVQSSHMFMSMECPDPPQQSTIPFKRSIVANTEQLP
ncbi:hypothetical protein TNCV_4769891 [Trichonephila clavipes]|nr:hypothetical protein TNCV_4769891 [Trichonephila clavipes]